MTKEQELIIEKIVEMVDAGGSEPVNITSMGDDLTVRVRLMLVQNKDIIIYYNKDGSIIAYYRGNEPLERSKPKEVVTDSPLGIVEKLMDKLSDELSDAVKSEDYAEALRLEGSLSALQTVGAKLVDLERK